MELYCINESCAAFGAEEGACIGHREAEIYIRRIIRERKLKGWDNINIDMFCAGKRRLFIAWPGGRLEFRIAPYAIPFIAEYFTE